MRLFVSTVVLVLSACGGRVECRVQHQIELAQSAASCYSRITGTVPSSLQDVLSKPECGLRVVPDDGFGRDLVIVADAGQPRVTTADRRTLPPAILCIAGPSVGFGSVLVVAGVALAGRGIVRRRYRGAALGAVVALVGLAVAFLGPVS
jgi:hypothetical protein